MLSEGQIIERFTVEARLGEGGMADVFRVRHNALGSLHALKLLKLHGDSIRRRLVTEGQVQAALRHPNIVAVTDVVFIGEQPALVMDLVEGPTLEDWLAEYQPAQEEAEALFRGVLSGVARAHRAGLVHRDLKPGNVLLDNADGVLIPKVADFGLAKVLDEDENLSMTRSGVAMGTPQYMAPEQIRNAKDVDQRADIWALGCILYQLVTGVRPFENEDIIELYSLIGKADYVPANTLVPGLPERCSRAIDGCLVADRANRIADCDTLRQILGGGTPVESVPGGVSRLSGTLTRAHAARASRLVPAVTAMPSAGFPNAPSTMGLEDDSSSAPPAPSGEPGAEASAEAVKAGPSRPVTVSDASLRPVKGPASVGGRAPLPVWVLLLGGLAVPLTLGGVGLLALGIYGHRSQDATRDEPVEELAAPPPETPTAEALPVPEPVAPVEEPAPEAPPEPEPPTAPGSVVQPSATRSQASPSNEPRWGAVATPTLARGTVQVKGDGSEVVLRSGPRTERPGAVPVGTYTATVTYPGREPITTKPFDVKEDAILTLSCSPLFGKCTVKETP